MSNGTLSISIGSSLKFSSVCDPFEFLDVSLSFLALWTFFICLCIFRLAPKDLLQSGHETFSCIFWCFVICWWFIKDFGFSLYVPDMHIQRPGWALCIVYFGVAPHCPSHHTEHIQKVCPCAQHTGAIPIWQHPKNLFRIHCTEIEPFPFHRFSPTDQNTESFSGHFFTF